MHEKLNLEQVLLGNLGGWLTLCTRDVGIACCVHTDDEEECGECDEGDSVEDDEDDGSHGGEGAAVQDGGRKGSQLAQGRKPEYIHNCYVCWY